MTGHWTLYVLGSRGSWPVCGEEFLEFGGGTSCYVLKRGDYAVLIDCGSGLYNGRELLAGCRRIDVLLTHIHYDHLLGLLNWNVFPENTRLRFFASFDRWFGADTLARFMSPPFWPYTPDMGTLINVPSPGAAELEEGVRVRLHPSCHPDGASIFRIDTPDGSVCAAFDYEHAAPFPLELAENCDVLLYDAMFTKEEYPYREGWGHSCWEEGGKVAGQAGVGQLVMTHHGPEKSDKELREQERLARSVIPGARFARQGDVFILRGKAGNKS